MFTVNGYTDETPHKVRPIAEFNTLNDAIEYCKKNNMAMDITNENDRVVYICSEEE